MQKILADKRSYWLLFGLIFLYINLRGIFNEPLHDEIATFYFYIYHGDFMGDTIVWDANNHLLNSFLCHWIYKISGEHFYLFRLPNILAFILYFWAVLQLTQHLSNTVFRFLSVVALTTITFLVEYFAYSRGYGLSMAFFTAALVYVQRFVQTKKPFTLAMVIIMFVLAVAANLTLVNSFLIVLSFLFFFIAMHRRSLEKKYAVLVILFVGFGSVIPFVLFGLALKSSGALYYGRLDGLFKVTGMSICNLLFKIEQNWFLFVFLLFFGWIVLESILRLRKQLFKSWLEDQFTIYGFIFFGNLVAIVLLAKVFSVNYPEDRTAMYFIPLGVLILIELLRRFESKKLYLVLLYTPVFFVFHLNIHTSLFSPDDRMTDAFYNEVKSKISPDESITIYQIMGWNWPYHEYKSKKKSSVSLVHDHNSTLTDVILTKTTVLDNEDILKYYDTIAYDPASTYIGFKLKQPRQKELLKQYTISNQKESGEYINLLRIDTLLLNAGDEIQATVDLYLSSEVAKKKCKLVLDVSDLKGNGLHYLYYPLDMIYHGKPMNEEHLYLHYAFKNEDVTPKRLIVYLWNQGLDEFEVSDGSVKLYQLKPLKDGTR